ncbi:MAG: hypothetical protein CM1200mP2_23570 [Planctomycetaceae bacterium]|nr:MAG: hypothetical protein CM1200mP2_23570 [Planctomycetaceae bacterium]
MADNSPPSRSTWAVVPVRLGWPVTGCRCAWRHTFPIPGGRPGFQVSDTWLHLVAYLGLAVLLVQGIAVVRPVSRRDAVLLWAVAVVYGASTR